MANASAVRMFAPSGHYPLSQTSHPKTSETSSKISSLDEHHGSSLQAIKKYQKTTDSVKLLVQKTDGLGSRRAKWPFGRPKKYLEVATKKAVKKRKVSKGPAKVKTAGEATVGKMIYGFLKNSKPTSRKLAKNTSSQRGR